MDNDKNVRLTPEQIAKLKEMNLPKPDGVPYEDWITNKRKLNHKQHLIAFHKSMGHSNAEIASMVGLSQSYISKVCGTSRMKEYIEYIRDKYFGESAKKILERNATKAADTVVRIMNKDDVKDSVRLQASVEVLNRTIGKPKETIEHRDNSIKDLFDALDRIGALNKHEDKKEVVRIVEVEAKPKQINRDIEVKKTNNDDSLIDEWVKDNL